MTTLFNNHRCIQHETSYGNHPVIDGGGASNVKVVGIAVGRHGVGRGNCACHAKAVQHVSADFVQRTRVETGEDVYFVLEVLFANVLGRRLYAARRVRVEGLGLPPMKLRRESAKVHECGRVDTRGNVAAEVRSFGGALWIGHVQHACDDCGAEGRNVLGRGVPLDNVVMFFVPFPHRANDNVTGVT